MDFVQITSQEKLDELIHSVKWGHPFIREIHAVSRSYITRDGGTVNPDAPMDWSFLVFVDNLEHPAIEFRCLGVQKIFLDFSGDLKFSGKYCVSRAGNSHIEFSFNSNVWSDAESMQYRFLGNDVLGKEPYYSRVIEE